MDWTSTPAGWDVRMRKDPKLVYAGHLVTDANGVWSGVLPEAGLALFAQPRTAGEFAQSVVVTGNPAVNATVTFRKFKAAGLGITLGTLLSVSAFEDVPGVVQFDLFGSRVP